MDQLLKDFLLTRMVAESFTNSELTIYITRIQLPIRELTQTQF